MTDPASDPNRPARTPSLLTACCAPIGLTNPEHTKEEDASARS